MNAANLAGKSTTSRSAEIRRLISHIDLTSLRGNDTEEEVIELCSRARYAVSDAEKDHCAAICVWPNFAKTASQQLQDSCVRVACVAGGFPYSQTSINVKTTEVREAIANGAEEIDFPINRSLVLHNRFDELGYEIQAIRDAAQDATLKVIIETCELPSQEIIKETCSVALKHGADFLKTSTGKGSYGATLEHTQVLFQKAAEWERETGKAIGVKPSGGIRDVEAALPYLEMADHYFGKASPENFRIGASSLLQDCLLHLSSKELINS